MKLQDVLDKEIQKNLSKDESIFYGLDDQLQKEQDKFKSTFAPKALEILQSVLLGADRATLDDVKLRLTRLENLKKYVKSAEIGDEEQKLLLDNIAKVESALKKYTDKQKGLFKKIGGIVSKSSIDVGALLIGMSAGDPLVALGVKLLGDALRNRKEKKLAAESNKQQALRSDAESLKNTPPPAPPIEEPLQREPLEPHVGESPMMNTFGSPDSKILSLLQDIFLFTEEISDDVKKLVKVAQDQEESAEREELDKVETSRESKLVREPTGKRGLKDFMPKKLISTFENIKDALGLAKDFALLGLSIPTSLLSSLAAFGPIAALAGGAVWAVIDGILGYFKADQWGTTVFSGAFGGFFGGTMDNTVLRTIGNMGKWALIGAGLGSVFPVVGTLLGGVIGAAIGGLLGWIGGENIAQFADDVGGFVKESAGKIFKFIWDGILGIFSWAKDLVSGILSHLPGYDDVVATIDAMWQKMKSTADKLAEATSSAGEGFTDMLGDATNAVTTTVGIGPVTTRAKEEQQRKDQAQAALTQAQNNRANRNRAAALDKTDGGHRREKVLRQQRREARTIRKENKMGAVSGAAPTGANPIKRVVRTGSGWIVVERPTGAVEKLVGTRAWRNNNPGNIEYGDFSKKMGAIGTDGRFAIFPDYDTGAKAKEQLIFSGNNYKNLDLTSAIARYAPPGENNTKAYQNAVLGAVGGENKKMSEYSPEQRTNIMLAMEKVEGFKQGSITPVSPATTAYASNAIPKAEPAPSNTIKQVDDANNQYAMAMSTQGGVNVYAPNQSQTVIGNTGGKGNTISGGPVGTSSIDGSTATLFSS